jgi:hypothetical protein
MSFVYRQYKGRDIELPLTDEMRKFLIGRSKDTLISECDEVWANLNNRPDEEEVESNEDVEVVEEVETYEQLNVTELKAEIDERNKDREEAEKIQVASNARKGDLIAALEADDEDDESNTND